MYIRSVKLLFSILKCIIIITVVYTDSLLTCMMDFFIYKQDFGIYLFEPLVTTLSPISPLKSTQPTVIGNYCTYNLGPACVWSVQAKKSGLNHHLYPIEVLIMVL